MTISREAHKFDKLNWVVSVISEDEPFLNFEGEEVYSFHFCTIPENEFYFPVPKEFNYIDQALQLEVIQNKFSGGPHKNSLAPIPSTSFSISNLELWYHKLCEINGDDLNTFEGAKIQIWMVNGLNPLAVWDPISQRWNNYNNTYMSNLFQAPNPTISTPQYPTNEKGYLVFTGTIEDIEFSTETTSFNCLGVSDRQNTEFGKLADPLAMKKQRGGIVPITFGDWTSEDDLIPVLLDRNQNQVPKIVLGEYPHKSTDQIRLYDKVSERNFNVVNKFVVEQDQNLVIFKDDQPEAQLNVNLPEDKTIYYEQTEVSDLRKEKFPNTQDANDPNKDNPATAQTLYDVNGEPIAFHSPPSLIAPLENTIYGDFDPLFSASRAWGDQPSKAHLPTEELFEIDQDYQKAIAIIDFTPALVGFYWGGKNFFNPAISAGVAGANSGNFWNVVKKQSLDETDSGPDINSFQFGGFNDSGATIAPQDFFSLEFEKIGFEGEILKTEFETSFWFFGGNDTGSGGTFSQDVTFFVVVKDPAGSTDILENNWFRVDLGTSGAGGGYANFSWLVDGVQGNVPPFDPDSRYTIYENLNPSTSWHKIKMAGNITTEDLTTIEELNSGRIGINVDIGVNNSPKASRAILDFMKWKFQARVDAESGLWFARGLGRMNSNSDLIETAPEAIQDLFTKEMNFDPNNFGTISTERSDWKTAFSIYGDQKKWRDVLKKIGRAVV